MNATHAHKTDLRRDDPDGVYLTDGGACYCGEHLGASARFTGCDISGQPIMKVTPDMMNEPHADLLACGTCGKKPARLWL
jgi:hypothetical protein